MRSSFFFIVFCCFLVVFLIFLDFYSKSIVLHKQNYYGEVIFSHFLGGVDFSLKLTQNRGAAWGLFSQFPIVLIGVRIAAVIAMLVYVIFFRPKRGEILGFILIISGALGNIADFFLYGAVVDFFSFSFWGWHFAIFNLADVFVTFGVIWLCCYNFFFRRAAV